MRTQGAETERKRERGDGEDACAGAGAAAGRERAHLRADNVRTDVERILDVFDGADHVHDRDARGVQLVDDGLGGHAHGAHEEARLGLDDDVDELIERPLGVCSGHRQQGRA